VQNLTAPPRDSLTAAQVTALLQAPSLTVSAGCELLDLNDNLVADISTDLAGGDVSRQNFANVHGTCSLGLSRALQWGRDRVRPYMTLTGAGVTARFNLGVFVMTTPAQPGKESPATFQVQGYDKLYLLDSPVGDTYQVIAGTNYLTAVTNVIAAGGGGTRVNLDTTAAAKTLPADMVWPLQETTPAKWLTVANDLLAAIGYRGLWVDQDGWYRSSPYVLPAQRAMEWTFDLGNPRTNIVGEDRQLTQDLWSVPNWWRFIQRSTATGTAPTGTAGMYTVTNQSAGISSIDARGRTVRKVLWLDAADQASLQAQGDVLVAADKQVAAVYDITTGPFPIAGHFDIATYSDSALGGSAKVQARSWKLPLDGSDMTWVWEAVS
jgi:hypothetical protein